MLLLLKTRKVRIPMKQMLIMRIILLIITMLMGKLQLCEKEDLQNWKIPRIKELLKNRMMALPNVLNVLITRRILIHLGGPITSVPTGRKDLAQIIGGINFQSNEENYQLDLLNIRFFFSEIC